MAVAIGKLEQAAERFAAKIRAMAYDVQVDTFRCGPKGAEYYGPSNVEITIERDEDDQGDGFVYETIKFLADAYGGIGPGEFGGETWTEMKVAAIDYLRRCGIWQEGN